MEPADACAAASAIGRRAICATRWPATARNAARPPGITPPSAPAGTKIWHSKATGPWPGMNPLRACAGVLRQMRIDAVLGRLLTRLYRLGRGVAGQTRRHQADRPCLCGRQGRLLPHRWLAAGRLPPGKPGRRQSRPGVTQRRLPLTRQATAGYSRGGRLPCCEILYVRQGFPPGPSNWVLTPMT